MNSSIELDILSTNYSKIGKFLRRIENYNIKTNDYPSLEKSKKMKLNKELNDLSLVIEDSSKMSKKFTMGIFLGALSSQYTENVHNHKIIYDLEGFSIYPNIPSQLDSDTYIADIYSNASIILIDEDNNLFKLGKCHDNYTLMMTNNECLFISKSKNEEIKRKMLYLVNGLCSKGIRLSDTDKIIYGIYKEKMAHFFDNIHMLSGYDLKEYYLAGLNLSSFNELATPSVIKLFKGEYLEEIERIAISKLTDKQIIDILNNYIQHNYKGKKLNNYIFNTRIINNIPGCIRFNQYTKIEEAVNSCEEIKKAIPNNIIEVDFVKKTVKK